MKNLKVGQRIYIYKIIGDNGYTNNVFETGTIRPEIEEIGVWSSGACLLSNEKYKGYQNISRFADFNNCKKVGTMVITKLK